MLRIFSTPLLALGVVTALVEALMLIAYLFALILGGSQDTAMMNQASQLLTDMTGILQQIHELMQTSGGAAFVMTAIFSAYFVPWLLAMTRRVGSGGVFVLNLFLGWTFIGWVIALAWASAGKTT